MNNSLNFIVKNRHTGNTEYKFMHQACYGSYVKHDKFKQNYLNHVVELYLLPFQMKVIREDANNKRVIELYESQLYSNGLCNMSQVLDYLNHFNGRYFNYTVEVEETTVGKANSLFNGQAQDSLKGFEGVDASYSYVKVTMDLSQFKSEVHAKNALFFIRNTNYSCNKTTLKLFFAFKYFVDSTNFNYFQLLHAGEVLGTIQLKTSGSEYNFFGRGYNSNGDKRVKCLCPIDENKYWDLMIKGGTKNIDDIMSSRYQTYNLTQDLILSIETIGSLISSLLKIRVETGKAFTLNERDQKMLLNYYKKFTNHFKLT